jgi:PAS domain S-box-containing protein
LGYSRDEFGKLRIHDYWVSDFGGDPLACMRKILREGPCRCEATHRTKKGENRCVMVHAQLITLHSERLLHCVYRDVTEQKRATIALQESQEQFRALVETTADWIWATDKDGTYTYCSPRVRALLGYEPEDVVGRTIYDFILPRESNSFVASVQASMSHGKPIARVEHTNLHKDGRHVVLETSAAPVFDASGALLGYRGIDRDVTEVKEARDLLRERERRYRQLLAAVTSYTYSVRVENGISVATMHGEGCVTVTGYRPEDYSRDSDLWCAMIHPDDRELVLEQVAKVFACQHAPPIEHRIFRRDGTLRWIRNTMIPHSEKGVLKHYDGLIEDITERKRAERAVLDKELQLLTAQKIQERLLPHRAPPLPGYDLAGVLYPAEFAAGDYFDYLPMDDTKLGIVIGDVSGHGFAPALIMASTHVMLRLLVETHTDVAQILTLANAALVKETDEEHFVTLLFACLDPATQTLVYGNAGHPPGYVFNSAGNIRARLDSTDFALGILPNVEFSIGDPITLEPGDTVLFVSDGILESRSPAGDFFGKERALQVVRSNLDKTCREIVETLCQAARGFCQEEVTPDDTTAVILKVIPG